MFKPTFDVLVTDVLVTIYTNGDFGKCYCHVLQWLVLLPLCFILADVIANYVMWDIVPHFILCLWQML